MDYYRIGVERMDSLPFGLRTVNVTVDGSLRTSLAQKALFFCYQNKLMMSFWIEVCTK